MRFYKAERIAERWWWLDMPEIRVGYEAIKK
jgi:hypothetical protein